MNTQVKKSFDFSRGTATFLGAGAAVALGLLSFSGMYTMVPIVALAMGSFGLVTMYEAEVFIQNIKGAFKKLSLSYIRQQMATKLLVQKIRDGHGQDCQFFIDYEKQLKRLYSYQDEVPLTPDARKRKRETEAELNRMEAWFSELVFDKDKNIERSQIESEVIAVFKQGSELDDLINTYKKRAPYYTVGKVLGGIGALCSTLGTIYLFGQALPLIPFIAGFSVSLAFPIITLSVFAGLGYGYMVYNAVADMITNETLKKYYHRIQAYRKKGPWHAAGMVALTIIVVGMITMATLFTAGTWWTIATKSGDAFLWLKAKAAAAYAVVSVVSGWFMQVVTPIVMAISGFVFDMQNSSDSIDELFEVYHQLKEKVKSGWKNLGKNFKALRERENWGQILNPFRITSIIIMSPVRAALFIAHLFGDGVVDNQTPIVPVAVPSAHDVTIAFIDDFHYFAGHDHHGHDHEAHGQDCNHNYGHDHHENMHTHGDERHDDGFHHFLEAYQSGECGHDHHNDIPTRFLRLVSNVVNVFSVGWDWAFSGKWDRAQWHDSWHKIYDVKLQKNVVDNDKENPSDAWVQASQAIAVREFKAAHFGNSLFCRDSYLAHQKCQALDRLETQIRLKSPETMVVIDAEDSMTFSKQRYWLWSSKKPTTTEQFVDAITLYVHAK